MLREKCGDKTNPKFIINDFTNISKSCNELVSYFNVIFAKLKVRILAYLRHNETLCLFLYCNVYDAKMGYLQIDKESYTLRDSYRMIVNIESN